MRKFLLALATLVAFGFLIAEAHAMVSQPSPGPTPGPCANCGDPPPPCMAGCGGGGSDDPGPGPCTNPTCGPCTANCGPPPCGANCGPPPCQSNCGPGPCVSDCGPPPCADCGPPCLNCDGPPPPEVVAAQNVCNAALGKLRKVTEAQVRAFENEPGVKIVPVCERTRAIKELADIDNSQAIHLQNAIAANPALENPLEDADYTADEVVGIVMTEQGAILYVHHGA